MPSTPSQLHRGKKKRKGMGIGTGKQGKEKKKLTTRPSHTRKHTKHKPKPQPRNCNARNALGPRIPRIKLPRDELRFTPKQPTENGNPPREVIARDEEAKQGVGGYTVD
jgi:hypothetical protein